MSPSKATHATILPPLPVAQGAPACSALLKEGTKALQTPIVGSPHAPGTAGCPWHCPGWQGSPACRWPAAACARGAQNQPAQQSHRSPTAPGQEPGGHECSASTGGMRGSRALLPGDTSFSRTQHRGCGTARTSPGATHSCHSPQRARHPLCHVCPPSEPSPRSTGTAWPEPPCPCQ